MKSDVLTCILKEWGGILAGTLIGSSDLRGEVKKNKWNGFAVASSQASAWKGNTRDLQQTALYLRRD